MKCWTCGSESGNFPFCSRLCEEEWIMKGEEDAQTAQTVDACMQLIRVEPPEFCPKCGEELKGMFVDMTMVGYYCENCKVKFMLK